MLSDLFSFFVKNFGKDLTKQAIKVIENKIKEFSFKEAGKTYEQEMKSRYGQMRIYGMPEPRSLIDIFTDIVVSKPSHTLNDFSTSYLEAVYLGERSYRSPLVKYEDAFEAVKKNNRLMVLGKPGAGKTTFLKNIILRTIETNDLKFIPVFISLNDFCAENQMSLMDYIEKQFGICSFPDANLFIKTMLKNGKFIVLFDGLDEVTTEDNKRNSLIKQLNEFTDTYNKNKFIITCRIGALNYEFEQFSYVEIADFNQYQIDIFINKWFNDKKDVASFYEAYRKNLHLKDLSKSPLLLTLLCISFSSRWAFSRNSKSEIYEIAIDSLIREWDASRKISRDIVNKITLRRARQLFHMIAEKSFRKEQFFFKKNEICDEILFFLKKIPSFYDDSVDKLDGLEILNEIISWTGILTIKAKNLYSFSHLTFQEYFTAESIIDSQNTDICLRDLFKTNSNDERWKEVFLLISEMLSDTKLFFNLFVEQIGLEYIEVSGLEELLNNTLSESEVQPKISEEADLAFRWMLFSTILSGILFINDAKNKHSQKDLHINLRGKLYSLSCSIVMFLGGESKATEVINFESIPVLRALRFQFLSWVYNCLLANKPLPYPSKLAYSLVRDIDSSETLKSILLQIGQYRERKQTKGGYNKNTKRKLQNKIEDWIENNCNFSLNSKLLDPSLLNYIYLTDLCLQCLNSSMLEKSERLTYLNKLLKPI